MPFSVFGLLEMFPKDLLIDNKSSINKYIMNFLSIDCSTSIGSLFVKFENKTFSKFLQSDKYSNDKLMKQILDFFKENRLNLEDLSQIFINQGPGNFSGLRGSIATAKGVSLSRNIKLSGYNTFIWSCGKFLNHKSSIFSFIKYKDRYFLKEFRDNFRDNSLIKEVTKDEIIKKYDKEFKIVPKKIIKDFDKKILKLNNLNIVELDHNLLEFLQLKGLLEEKMINPLYLS